MMMLLSPEGVSGTETAWSPSGVLYVNSWASFFSAFFDLSFLAFLADFSVFFAVLVASFAAFFGRSGYHVTLVSAAAGAEREGAAIRQAVP